MSKGPGHDPSRALIEGKLRHAWGKERRFHHARGLCILVVWAVALILVDLLVDWLFLASYRAPGWARLALLGINLVTLAVVVQRYWWRHLRGYDPVRVALEFERKHPELKSLLVSYVQISDETLGQTDASPALVAALRRQAVTTTQPMNFKEVISYRLLAKLMVFSLGVVAAFGAISIYKTEFFHTLLQRMLNPQWNIAYPTRTTIASTSGNLTVRQGNPVELEAAAGGEVPQRGSIYIKADDGSWETLALLKKANLKSLPPAAGPTTAAATAPATAPASRPGTRATTTTAATAPAPATAALAARTPAPNEFAYRLFDARRSFEYYIRLGDCKSSTFRVEVIPAPKVLSKKITLTFPPHTHRAAENNESYYVEVPEGTKVTWQMRLDRPVREARLRRNFQDANSVDLKIRDGGLTVECDVAAQQSFDYQFRWKLASHGFVYDTPGAYTVNVTPDLPPDVEIVQPMEDEKATVNKRLMVKFHATDDYGLAEANLIYSIDEGAPQKWKIADLGDRKELTEPLEKKLSDLIPGLKEQDVVAKSILVTYYIEVADNRAGPRGHNVSRSHKRRVYVVTTEEYLRSIMEERLRWMTEVEEMRVEERKASKQVGELKNAETQPASQPSKP